MKVTSKRTREAEQKRLDDSLRKAQDELDECGRRYAENEELIRQLQDEGEYKYILRKTTRGVDVHHFETGDSDENS